MLASRFTLRVPCPFGWLLRVFFIVVFPALALQSQAQTNLAILAPDGAWTWYNDPRALFHNSILYFGYVRTDGESVLSSFNPVTGVKNDLWLSSRTEKDDHDNPGLLVREDNRILAIQARHSVDQFFAYHISTTTNPVTAADWGPEQTVAATGAGLTYANPFQLSEESGKVYDFSRDLNFNPTVFTSGDGGASWSPPQAFIKTGTGSIRPYVKYVSDYTRRMDFLYTDGHPRDLTNSLYHLYYQSNSLYKTDGTFLKSFTNLPVLHDSGERGSIIYQYSDADTTNFNDHIATGRAWCWEICYQTNGAPACVFTVQRDRVTGPNWFDDRIYYYYARWTGTNWQKRFIAQAGRPLFNPENDYAGGICLDPSDPNTIYISSNAADPFNTTDITNVTLRANSRYEIWRGRTTDGGLTFSWSAITTNSAKDNLRPYIPRRQAGTPVVSWFRGVYTTFSSYNCEVVGLFNNPVPSPPAVTIASPLAAQVNFTDLSDQLHLVANASDDGQPGPLSLHWTTVSGPGAVTFSNPNSTDTVASFPLAGSYRLRVAADDTASTNQADVLVVAGPTPDPDAPDTNRVLWLKLDESSGTIASDSSGNGNSGALSGNAVWQPGGGVHGGAIKLDGTNGLVTIADNAALDNTSAFTLMYWFKANAYPADSAGLVCKRVNINTQNAYTTYLKAADKKIYVDIDSSNNRFSSTTLFQTGSWYHVAFVFDGSLPAAQRVSMYVNGLLDTTAAESSATIPDYSSSVLVGNTHTGAANWFNGSIDDARFYRRALTSGEIAAFGSINYAPDVTAGPAPAATSAISSSITGRVLDDGKGGSLSARWSKVNGPGTVTFGNSNLVAASATFERAGTYVLRLCGSDTQAEMCQDVSVSVSANTNVFYDWIDQFYAGETNAGIVGFTADPDADGVRNLVEFALGMNPTVSNTASFSSLSPGLPIGLIKNFGGTNFLSLAVKHPVGRLGISLRAEVSSDLQTWATGVLDGSPISNGDGTETLYFRDVVPASGNNQRFIRLAVQTN
jgi:hypothetical protein